MSKCQEINSFSLNTELNLSSLVTSQQVVKEIDNLYEMQKGA